MRAGGMGGPGFGPMGQMPDEAPRRRIPRNTLRRVVAPLRRLQVEPRCRSICSFW